MDPVDCTTGPEVDLLKYDRTEPAPDGEHTLNQVPEGEQVSIVRIVPGHPEQMIRLSGMGVVPGAVVRVRQRRPAVVVALGETTLALDP